jgi:hypothetical protein
LLNIPDACFFKSVCCHKVYLHVRFESPTTKSDGIWINLK